MKIAFDLDGVLVDFVTPFFRWYNQRAGTSFQYDDNMTHEFTETLGITKKEYIELLEEFLHLETLYQKPIPFEAKELLARLKEEHELYILTSRYTALEKTRAWLERELPGVFRQIIFKNENFKAEDKRPSKGRVAEEHGIELLVEDRPKHIVSALQTGLAVIVFDQPWNREETPPGALRAHNWGEVEGHIKQLSR